MDTVHYIIRFLTAFFIMVIIVKIIMNIANRIGEQIVKFFQGVWHVILGNVGKK